MKKIYSNIKLSKVLIFTMLLLGIVACEREEQPLPNAEFPSNGDIFLDGFIGMGTNFYFPFVADGAKPDVFSVDDTEGFESTSSIRIDVPDADDPGGSFAGAAFVVDGGARNLTNFNALTFYARSSQSAIVSVAGFGLEYLTLLNNLRLTNNWKQFIIPIPDASKLTEVREMFIFSAGGIGEEGQEVGYSFWIDELKFENLSTVAQPLATIMDGEDEVVNTFNGVTLNVTGTNFTSNVDGTDVTVGASPAYYNFVSSDPTVVDVDELGRVTILGAGTSTITATLGQGDDAVEAQGSLTVVSSGAFLGAPTPPARDADDVVSIFSDAYENVQVDNYNGFFQFATTQGGAVNIESENIISYTQLNFVSINMFNSPNVDASDMTHIHVDINVRETVNPGDFLRLQIINNNGPTETTGAVNLGNYSPLLEEEWVSYDIPLSDFSGLGGTDDIDLIFFISDATIQSIYVDNVYFYRP